MREINWSRTPLGAPEHWPQSLRTALSLLLDSRFAMMIAWGPSFTQFYNDPFRQTLGESKHPALARSVRETFPEAWHVLGPVFEQVMQGQSLEFHDMLVPLERHGYREECYFHYSYSPIRDESGGVGGVHLVVDETTPRVLAERRLETLRELATRINAARSEREVWAAADEVLAKNALDIPFVFQYGLAPDGASAMLIGRQGTRLAPARMPLRLDEPGVWPLDPELPAGQARFLRDILARFGHHAGRAWPEPVAEALVLPITRAGLARPYGFLVAGVSPRRSLDQKYRDFFVLIAEQLSAAIASARAHEQEQQRAELLLELDRQRSAFFSNLSHELHTPLTLILGPVEAARGSPEHALRGSALESVARNARQLSKLLGTLLELARIQANQAQPCFEPSDAAALTAEIAAQLAPAIERAGLSLRVRCSTLPRPVYLDAEMWEKIVSHLLWNAFNFTLAGSIELSLTPSDAGVLLAVSDTGAGIPAADLPHVFERFPGLDSPGERTREGSGLGLRLVHELVKLHRGRIEVESQVGAGSCFRVCMPWGSRHLPAERVRERPAPVTGRATRAAIAALDAWLDEPSDGVRPEPSPRRRDEQILVVDESPDMREYLRGVLASEGFSVRTERDAAAAFEGARQHPPSLVLADAMTLQRGGLALLEAFEAHAATAHVPVILLSARAGDEAAARALSARADDHLVKPFSARELSSRVEACLEIARARADALRARERLRAQLLQAPVAVAIMRCPDFVYELANPLYLELIGQRDVVGKAVRDVFPELPIDAQLLAVLERVCASGEPFSASEYRLTLDRRAAGVLEDAYFKLTCQPVRDESGSIVEIMTVAVDMTAEVEARHRIEKLVGELQLADQRKDEFLATLAHELRNPMAAICTALSLLEQPDVETDAALRYRGLARRQMSNLTRLVDDLLDVARITRGTIELRKEPVDLASVVEQAVLSARALIESRGHALTVDIEPGASYHVDGDPTRLEQIVMNLLTNAAKYTERGGCVAVQLGCERRARPARDVAVLRVRDNGRGIPEHMLEHVFEPFTQVSPSIDRRTGGLGLGLTLVRHLTEMHDGLVRAHSGGRGRGSEFTIRLPLMAHIDTPIPKPPQAPSATGRHRILVVEDSEDVRELLAECLQSLGHEVFSAADGLAGVDRFASVKPDVALVDVGLPGIDGYELARRIRAQPGGDKTHLVALTGYGGQDVTREAHDAGFDLHLTKPVDIDGLVAVLAAYEKERKA